MSDNYSVKAEISADTSEFSNSIKNAMNSLNGFGSSIKNVQKLVGAGFAVASVKKFTSEMSEIAKLYVQQEKAEKSLEVSARNNPYLNAKNIKALKDYASELQSISEIGDEQLLPLMARLASAGRTQEEIQNIMKASLDASASGAISLDGAIRALNASYSGQAGRLSMLLPEISALSKEELKAGKAVDAVAKAFNGMAKETANSAVQLKNSWGDLKEQLGYGWETAMSPMRKGLQQIIDKWTEALKKANDAKKAMNNLDSVIAGETGGLENVSSARTTAESVKAQKEKELAEYERFAELSKKKRKELTKDENKELLQLRSLYLERVRSLYQQEGETDLQAIQSAVEAKRIEWQKSVENLRTLTEQENQLIEKGRREKAEADRQAQAQQLSDLRTSFDKKVAQSEEEARLMWQTGQLEDELAVKQKILNDAKSAYVAMIIDSNGAMSEDATRLQLINDLTEECIRLQKELEKQTGTETKTIKKNTKKMSESWGDFSKALVSYNNDIVDEAMNWEGFFIDSFETVRQKFGEAFTALGEALVEGENGWQNWGAVALEALAEVLNALGAQLSAWAISKAMAESWGEAALATAGSIAAFTASGAIKGVANQMKTVANESAETLKTFKQIKDAIDNINKSMNGFTSYISGYRESAILHQNATERLAEETQKQAEREKQAQAYKNSWKKYQALYYDALKNSKGYDGSFIKMYRTSMNENRNLYNKYKGQSKDYKDAVASYEATLKQMDRVAQEALNHINDSNKALDVDIANTLSVMQRATTSEKDVLVLKENIRNSFKSLQLDVLNDLSTIGQTFADGIYNSLNEGLGSDDLMKDIRKTLRSQMIKLSVYTTEVTDKLTWFSRKAIDAITNHNEEQLKDMKWQMENLFKELQKEAKEIDAFFDDVFGNIEDNIESLITTVEDMATDIGDELATALGEGLEQGDFMDTMKNYLRKMVIQSVVYTQSLQAEIKAIGQAISEGVANGFSETGLHEIKRDLSFIFEQANSAIGKIDSVINSVFDKSGYAVGTPNATAGLHLVGEAGAELVRFRGGEQVYNAQDTQKILSGAGGQTFNYTFNNLQDTTAYAMMKQLKAYDRQMAIDGIL